MTANLLAHAPHLFCCGVARSGAYNRTLTPFGFQVATGQFHRITLSISYFLMDIRLFYFYWCRMRTELSGRPPVPM